MQIKRYNRLIILCLLIIFSFLPVSLKATTLDELKQQAQEQETEISTEDTEETISVDGEVTGIKKVFLEIKIGITNIFQNIADSIQSFIQMIGDAIKTFMNGADRPTRVGA